jgi:epoxide hydrolase-like predicted phosphatase
MKTILFDFFGVLSSPAYKKIFEKYLPEEELADWMAKLDVLDTGDITEKELVKQISDRANITEDQIWKELDDIPQVNERLLNFIETNLKGKYKVGLLTNIPRSLLERIIPEKMNEFDPLLISSDLKLIKPDRRIFEVAIERSGCLPNEILFIDDGQRNIESAKTLGINGIVYENFPQFLEELKKYIEI